MDWIGTNPEGGTELPTTISGCSGVGLPVLQTSDLPSQPWEQPPALPTPPHQVFPEALEPDEPLFYLGTILLLPFLSCAPSFRNGIRGFGYQLAGQESPPHSTPTLALWAVWAK